MEDLARVSKNLFNLAVKQLEELGYDLENTYYAVSRGSTYSIFGDNDDSPSPGISLVLTMPKLGYIGVCLQINNEQCEHKIWCNTEEQVTAVISNLDSIIKYWHQTILKLDLLYKDELMSQQRDHVDSIDLAVSSALEEVSTTDEDEEMGWYPS